MEQGSNEEKLARKLEEANQKIRILENMVENQTRELYYTNMKSIAFLESAPDAMIISDKIGQIILVNAQAERLFGYSREELQGKKVEILIPDLFQEYLQQYGEQRFAESKVEAMGMRTELTGRKKEGSELPVEISLRPVIIDADLFICTAIRDVTEQRQAAEDLKEYASQLEISNRELEQFAYVASHDLQEPLKTITNYTSLFQTRYADKLDDETLVFMDYIVKSAERMKALISALLYFSRIGRDHVLTDIDCCKLVAEVVDDMWGTIRENDVRVNIGQLPHIHGSETEIKQVFQNLISNAIKFRKQGQQAVINISCAEDDEAFVFAVEDNGIGVPAEYQEKIFLIFQRLHTVEKYPGTGIGLAICKKIISLYDGRIWLKSDPGKGATVCFSIPKQEHHTAA